MAQTALRRVEGAGPFGLVDLGQLSEDDHRELRRLERSGRIVRFRGGPFPAIKTCWKLAGRAHYSWHE